MSINQLPASMSIHEILKDKKGKKCMLKDLIEIENNLKIHSFNSIKTHWQLMNVLCKSVINHHQLIWVNCL